MLETIIVSLMLVSFGGYVIFSERQIKNIKNTHERDNINLYEKIHKEIEYLAFSLAKKAQIESNNRPYKTLTIIEVQAISYMIDDVFKHINFCEIEHGDFLCYKDCIDQLEKIVLNERKKQKNNVCYTKRTTSKYKHDTLRDINSK